jgi:hypothetical protein
MGASPEAFREVDGSRIAAVSVFLPKPCDHRASPARLNYSTARLWQIALAFA